jgi:hypothetical protein
MAELPSLPKLYPLQSTEVESLKRQVDLNFNSLLIYLQRLRSAMSLRVSVNGVAIAGVTSINLVSSTGITIVPAYDLQTEVLTLTISSF